MALIYFCIYGSAGSKPSAAQVKAGQDATGSAAVAAGSEAELGSSGVMTWSSAATGLTAGTSYKIAFVHADGADADVVESGAWGTDNRGVLSTTLGAVTLSSAGALNQTGALSTTLDAVTLTAAGALDAGITGALASTLDAAAVVAAGALEISGAQVLQWCVGGLHGARYMIGCEAADAGGWRLVEAAVLPVRQVMP